MRNKLLTALAFSFALSTGAAFGQSSSREQPVIDTTQLLASFHTDSSMMQLRPAEENREIFLSLETEEQQALREQCAASVAETTDGVDETTTSSIEEMPMTTADLCAQIDAW